MTYDEARRWVIFFSLTASGVVLVFCFSAPVFGYPLVWSEALRLAETVLPIFTAYLGTAAGFAFGIDDGKDGEKKLREPGPLLIKWPPAVCWFGILVLLVAFGHSNRSTAIDGSGMSIQQLALGISLALSVITTTTGAAMTLLFRQGADVEGR